MSRFVITISPETVGADDATSAQTTVRVDTSTGQTRITELTVRAADGGGLAPADLPAVDLELLIRALGASSVIRALPATDTHEEARDETRDGTRGGVAHLAEPADQGVPDSGGTTGTETEAVESPVEQPAEPSEVVAELASEADPDVATPARRRAATKRPATRKATGRAASGRAGSGNAAAKRGAAKRGATGRASAKKAGARKSTAAKVTPAKAARAKATAPAKATRAKATGRSRRAAGGGEPRAYRRMPEPAEVLAAYSQAGSITALAEHYGVPRHTANGWARRLRSMGYSIGRS